MINHTGSPSPAEATKRIIPCLLRLEEINQVDLMLVQLRQERPIFDVCIHLDDQCRIPLLRFALRNHQASMKMKVHSLLQLLLHYNSAACGHHPHVVRVIERKKDSFVLPCGAVIDFARAEVRDRIIA